MNPHRLHLYALVFVTALALPSCIFQEFPDAPPSTSRDDAGTVDASTVDTSNQCDDNDACKKDDDYNQVGTCENHQCQYKCAQGSDKCGSDFSAPCAVTPLGCPQS